MYQDDTAAMAGIQAEIEKLNSYKNLLVSYASLGLDDSSLQAEKTKLKASKDPDAYDPDQIATALAAIEENETVMVYNINARDSMTSLKWMPLSQRHFQQLD